MDWLKSLSIEIKIEDIPLQVLSVDELPKSYLVIIHVKDPDC